MKQKIRLNERQLQQVIKESVRKILREMEEYDEYDDEDRTIVNKQQKGLVPYEIRLWCGSGYIVDLFKVYSEPDDMLGALARVVAYLDKKGDDSLFIDDAVMEDMEDFKDKNGEVDYDAWDDYISRYAIYVDATPLGASKPHYVFEENLEIEEL